MKENTVKRATEPLKSNAPLSGSSKERLISTVQKQRLVCKELEGRTAELTKEIERNSIPIDEAMEKDMLAILADRSDEVTPHMKVFWEQQRKLLAMTRNPRHAILRKRTRWKILASDNNIKLLAIVHKKYN